MASYESFAEIYDQFMDNVPYDAWCQNLITLFHRYGIDDGLVAELGCGTGNMTERMADAGFDMTGIDYSVDMLEIAGKKQARRRAEDSGNDGTLHDILYLCQDMREFELYGTMRGIYAVCDAMNYLTQEEDVLTVLKLVNNYLDPGGVFIFDLVSEAAYRSMGDDMISDLRPVGSFIWQNSFDEASKTNIYDVTMFIREDAEDFAGRTLSEEEEAQAEDDESVAYHRFHEMHLTRAYDPETIRGLIEKSGMRFCGVLDADTMGEITEETGRCYFIAQECMKRAPQES